MPVSELSPTAEVRRGGYRAPDRRAKEDDPVPPAAASPTPEPQAEPFPLDVAFFASRFRADLSRLGLPAEPEPERPDASESHGDPALFDFFGNLNVLLLAVRAGDLPRAQAAANALEMEVLVERSAGRHGEAGPTHRLGELVRLLGAAPSRDETAAASPQEPPPDPYAEHEADAGGAAYDTLAHYFDAETPAV